MRHYEIAILVHPDQSEQTPSMIERYTNMIKEAKGKIHRLEDCGRRPLAYGIEKVHKAHFVLMNIECAQTTLNELEEAFRYNDAILRHLTIRRKEAVTDVSAFTKPSKEEFEERSNDRYGKTSRRKNCRFTADGVKEIDYKDVNVLKAYITETGKIIPSRITGTCAKYQRQLATAVRRARFMALLAYCDNHE